MEPPAITRRRRPFLMPLWLVLMTGLGVLGVGLALWARAANTVVVIVPQANGALGSIANPPLSAEGGQQAERLARRFANASGREGLEAIFVSRTRRAEQTASPLAELLGFTPIALAGRDGSRMAAEIMGRYGGHTVLVVCTRAAIVRLIRALAGRTIRLPASRDMFFVTVPRYGPAKVLRMTI
jgi:broad specificity phosphatase PhoE